MSLTAFNFFSSYYTYYNYYNFTKCSCVRFFSRYCLLLYDYVSIGVANSTIETFRCGGWKSWNKFNKINTVSKFLHGGCRVYLFYENYCLFSGGHSPFLFDLVSISKAKERANRVYEALVVIGIVIFYWLFSLLNVLYRVIPFKSTSKQCIY